MASHTLCTHAGSGASGPWCILGGGDGRSERDRHYCSCWILTQQQTLTPELESTPKTESKASVALDRAGQQGGAMMPSLAKAALPPAVPV